MTAGQPHERPDAGGDADAGASAAQGTPEIVVTGGATPEQTAALVVALTALSRARAQARRTSTQPGSLWNSRSRAARPPLRPGPGAWRASRLPR